MSVFPPMNLGQDLGFCLSLDIRPSITFVKWMNTHKFWFSKDLHIIKLKVYHSEINSHTQRSLFLSMLSCSVSFTYLWHESEVKVTQSCLTLCNLMNYVEFSRPEYWTG